MPTAMCECPATFEMHPHRPRYHCPPEPYTAPPPVQQRRCSAKNCDRVDVQPGTYHPPDTCRRRPAAFCPRHTPSESFFTPTPPEPATVNRKPVCFCRVGSRGHVYDPTDRCPDDHPTDPFNGPAYVRADDGGAVMCACPNTYGLHHWHRGRGCPPDPVLEGDPMSEVGAQVQCYCTGRGPDSASGHLWRKDRGCPNSPAQPFLGDHPAATPVSDERVLADLFRRALKVGLLDLRIQVRPNYAVQLEAGQNTFDPPVFDLTDHEVEVIRKRAV